jgi:4-hydroxybutyryl-CoA dehydratase/vinylacetyl-CoA-Delta-isomerase
MHEFLVMPCRTHTKDDAAFAVCYAVPIDAPAITIVAWPAGRPGEPAAKFSAKYGQSTGVVIFDDVFVPHEQVFLAGEHEEAGFLTTTYATHHRHSRIGARRLRRFVDRGGSLDATPLLSCRAFACHL